MTRTPTTDELHQIICAGSRIPLDEVKAHLGHVDGVMLGRAAYEQPAMLATVDAVFYGDKAIDRSPCGTGTSARLAHLHAKGKLKVGDTFVHESYICSRFTGRVEAETEIGGKRAIIPSIEGSAMATGRNEIWIDTEDPFAHGFVVV